MRKVCWMFAFLGILLGISGCASYSNLVNAYAPEKQKTDFALGSIDSQKSPGKSPFCAEPPVKQPPHVKEVYMVMPEGGGKAGTIDVTLTDGQQIVLHGDYSAMSLAGEDKKTYVGDQTELQKTFGTAVAALPEAPSTATLYFVLGKDELTPESKMTAEDIYSDFVKRRAPEIVIVGHTDTVGSVAENEKLSVKRAEMVKQSLIKRGVPAESIHTSGRGKRELLVQTPDNTKEPKNRRVEISVR